MANKRWQKESSKPSDGEFRILNVLWKIGPCTVRQVFEELEEKTGAGYTTILKYLQIMHEKGLVTRDESARSHVYAANLSRDDAQEQIVDDLLDTVFDGSRGRLGMRIISQTKASPKELADIKNIIADLEKEETP